MKRILTMAVVTLLSLLIPYSTFGQAKPIRHEPAPAAESPAPDEVNIRDAFSLTTGSEHWSLEDPLPATIDFGGKAMSLEERQVNVSTGMDGEQQYLFPVSWFEPYQGSNPDMKYVVVKYRNGKACSVMVEYLPNRVALPKDTFQPHPDGKSYYSDVSFVRQGGMVYLKQAISSGHDDGHGGYYVDMLVMYCMEDKTPKPATATARP